MISLINRNIFYRKFYYNLDHTSNKNEQILFFIKENKDYFSFDIENLKKKVEVCSDFDCIYSNYLDNLNSNIDFIKNNILGDIYKSNSIKIEKIFDKFLLKIVSCNKNYEELKKLDPTYIFSFFPSFDGEKIYCLFVSIKFEKSYFMDPVYKLKINTFYFYPKD